MRLASPSRLRAGARAITPGRARFALILVLVAAWQIFARFGDPTFVAPPSATALALWRLAQTKAIMAAVGQALWELAASFAIASVVGAALGLVLGRSQTAHRLLFPIALLLYSLPQTPLLPLLVLGFGIGPSAKIAFGVSHAVFPMLITVAAGVRDIDQVLLKAARSMGASRWRSLWSVVLPSAAASFFTALRLSMASALLGVLLAELFVSQTGVGFWTRRFANNFEPADLFALIAMLAAIAIAMNESCRLAERWFNRWRR